MGRDALKLGMIQRMILYCARILYLKCISELKVNSGDRFPICLLINGVEQFAVVEEQAKGSVDGCSPANGFDSHILHKSSLKQYKMLY